VSSGAQSLRRASTTMWRLAATMPLSVLGISLDDATVALLRGLLPDDRLRLVADLHESVSIARDDALHLALVDVSRGDGAGLALVHHLKVLAPDVSIVVLVSPDALKAGADAVGLGASLVLLQPVGGDDLQNVISGVRSRIAERDALVELEREAQLRARASGWMGRLAALTEAPDRMVVARSVSEVLAEAMEARGVGVYLPMGADGRAFELAAVAGELTALPAHASREAIAAAARERGLSILPLVMRGTAVGEIVVHAPSLAPSRPSDEGAHLAGPPSRARSAVLDGLIPLLRAQASAALALLAEREQGRGGALKDPASSAYSFAYYVDAAGREIDRARRHGRRFSLATVLLDASDDDAPKHEETPTASEVAEWVLRATSDTDMLARVDEHEFHVLMVETDGLAAHATRRRILTRVVEGQRSGRVVPRSVLVGVATFPHDGSGLAQLMRTARSRAEASRGSVVHSLRGDAMSLADLFERVASVAARIPKNQAPPRVAATSAPRLLELDAAGLEPLLEHVTQAALRAGSASLAVLDRGPGSLAARARKLAESTPTLSLHAVDVRQGEGDADVLVLSAENACYTLLARTSSSPTGRRARLTHSADPLLADLVLDRLGRAGGVRLAQ
jgi:GGDEF domain-containing protein/DNA-binding NarL/FixJ family response regulator